MQNPLISIRSQDAVIKTIWLSRLKGAIVSAHHQVTVVRMDERQRFAAHVTPHVNFSWLNAEDAIELVRPRHNLTAKVPVPTADMGQSLRFGQLTLTLLELLLGLLALCNVLAN